MATGKKTTVRDQTIPLRVTTAEKQAYEQAAEKVGNTVSGWIRYTCTIAVGKAKKS